MVAVPGWLVGPVVVVGPPTLAAEGWSFLFLAGGRHFGIQRGAWAIGQRVEGCCCCCCFPRHAIFAQPPAADNAPGLPTHEHAH